MKLYFASLERLCGLSAVVCARMFSTLPIAAVLLLLLSYCSSVEAVFPAVVQDEGQPPADEIGRAHV